MTKSAKLIINPAAGRGRAAALLPEIQSALKRAGIETDVARTRAPREAIELAQRAKQDGFELVIAAGGDGTVHEVVNGLVRAAGDAVAGRLGILPLGSGNDLAFALAIPGAWQAACERIAGGQTRRIDVGLVNGEVMANSAGIGFEAQVGLEARKIRWARGALIYVAALVETLRHSYRTPWVTLTADGETISAAITNVTIGNGRRAGASFFLTPQADPADGVFDVCIAAGMGRVAIAVMVPSLMRGTHTRDRRVRMLRARKLTLACSERLPMHIDGELIGDGFHQTIEAELLPGRLEVIV